MNIEEYLKFVYIEEDVLVEKFKLIHDLNLKSKYLYNYVNPLIICNDGFSISVQGGPYNNSTPKKKLMFIQN